MGANLSLAGPDPDTVNEFTVSEMDPTRQVQVIRRFAGVVGFQKGRIFHGKPRYPGRARNDGKPRNVAYWDI
jgi:hypothetical protein